MRDPKMAQVELKVGQQWKGHTTTATIVRIEGTDTVFYTIPSLRGIQVEPYEHFLDWTTTDAELVVHPQQVLQDKVKALAVELPGITFGYLDNQETWGDDREWMVFLPTPGRMGTYADRVALGHTTGLADAVANWDHIETTVRSRYHNGAIRVLTSK
jgi:hypothetical protein